MKINIFDVVELKNGTKAIILYIYDDKYKVNIIDKNGESLGISQITNSDILRIIYSKNNFI